MKQLTQLKLIVATFLFIVGCEYRLFDPVVVNLEDPSLDKIQSPDEALTEPNFQSIFKTVIQPQCLSCHESGGKAELLPFESYQDIMNSFEPLIVPEDPNASLFYQVLLPEARRPMPPPRSGLPRVKSDQVDAIRRWIEVGAPEFSETF